MRYFFAITSLVLAAVLLILGVGQRTFLAGPKVIEHRLETSGAAEPYLVVPAEMFDAVAGSPAVVIAGDKPFLAIGHERDVDAWVRSFEHGVTQLDEETGEFTVAHRVAIVEPVEGEAYEEGKADEDEEEATLLDPRGSDLWVAENTAETSLKVSLGLLAKQSLLITSITEEGFETPDSVTLSWAQPRNTPLAGPLLVAGGVFAIVGVILYLLAIDHNRRGIGPRRGRSGPLQGLRNKKMKQEKAGRSPASKTRRGSRMGFTAAVATVSMLALTACSPSYWPDFSDPQPTLTTQAAPEEKNAVVPVTDVQIENILGQIVAATNAGDQTLDAGAIKDRLASSAKAQRDANYKILKEEPDWRKLPVLTTERLQYDLIQSTEKWPRTMFITVESRSQVEEAEAEPEENLEEPHDEELAEIADAETEEQTPSLALVLTQESPHTNYVLNRVVELRGGIEMPEAAALSEGTALLTDDIQTLQLSPRDAASALADAMKNGEDSETYDSFKFNEELLIDKMGGAWARDQCVDGLKCSVDVVLSEEPVVTLSTGQSGALVLATLLDKHTMTVKNDRNIVKLSKVERALGLDGSYTSVTRQWQHQVLLYVPGKDSDKKITVLGSSSELVKASGKKA